MTRFITFLTTAILVAGFVPFGNATVCIDGEIAIGQTFFEDTKFWIFDNNCDHISSKASDTMCGSYGDSVVYCDSTSYPTIVETNDKTVWASCRQTNDFCVGGQMRWCCKRMD